MKKILFAVMMIFAMFFLVSCAEDEIGDAVGGSCAEEGAETCSEDAAQILICRDFSWQTKKTCNLNFGQYCRQTASGSYGCSDTDSGNTTTDPAEPTSDNTEPTGTETNNEPTDPEPSDNEPTENNEPTDDNSDSAPDNEPTDDNSDSAPDNEPEETETPIPAPGDCANIMKCIDGCSDQTCAQNCYSSGTIDGKAQYDDLLNCGDEKSCENDNGYSFACLWENCRDKYAVCGLAGDTANYKIPYGKANISGTFTYLHSTDEINNNEIYTNHIIQGGFISGSFGKTNASLANDSSYALAIFFPEETEGEETYPQYISLFQAENASPTTLPTIQMILQAPTTGSYTFGLGAISEEKVRMLVRNWDDSAGESGNYTCDHAFGYGTITISDISYELGETKISLSGQIDLYSYKAMPYYGGDISDSQYFIACEPK